MKSETRSFYQLAVERAVVRISESLDDALDLSALAKSAALSPFHFHRIFRGLLGETPLEMHRRLRLERAASELLGGDMPVTRVALAAGYETHEAFTRAFHKAFATSPSAFRQASGPACSPVRTHLASQSGVHFHGTENRIVRFVKGESLMNVVIEDRPELRIATIAHVGPYDRIGEAFARLHAIAGSMDVRGMIAVYYDDPESTPAAELRSDAAVVVPDGTPLPPGVVEKRVPAGRYAHVTHVGPYTGLGDAWARFMGQWLPRSGHRVGDGSTYELYRNTPMTARPEELETELYLSIA